MKLGSDGASFEIQDKRDCRGVAVTQSNEDGAVGAGLPAWYLLTITKLLVKDVDRTAPYMTVLELCLWPACLGEEIMGAEAIVEAWHVIPKECRVIDCKGPETWGGNIRPMDGAMKHHGACDRHDGTNCALSNSVVMMRANTSKVSSLAEGFKMVSVLLRGEDSSVVTDVFLCNDTMITSKPFKFFFCLDGTVSVQRDLMANVNVARGMVNKDGPAAVL
jgi:hypothetical protein